MNSYYSSKQYRKKCNFQLYYKNNNAKVDFELSKLVCVFQITNPKQLTTVS